MTKTLGSAALQLYVGVTAMFLPIENQPGLIEDVESDPFVGHALSSATCELYHRYGMYLAPPTATLTTLKHCQLGHCCPVGVYDGGDEAGESRDGGGASTVLQWKELRRKLRIQRKWQPSVPALPPERQSKKNDFSSSFKLLRSHFTHPTLPPPPTPPPTPAAPANIPPPPEADQAVSQPERREGLTNWAPWVIGACLAGGALVFLRQTRSPATGPVDSAPKQPAPDAKQLKT